MAVTPLREERTTEERVAPVLLMGLRALNQRALVWLVTIAAGFGWGVTILHPDLWRIVAATLACITMLFPCLWWERRGE